MRYYQDRFDTRRLADRLEQVRHDTAFNNNHRKIIERSTFFFLATTDTDGWPDCSYKGGLPGFVRVADEHTLSNEAPSSSSPPPIPRAGLIVPTRADCPASCAWQTNTL
jgi:hypothetical protein